MLDKQEVSFQKLILSEVKMNHLKLLDSNRTSVSPKTNRSILWSRSFIPDEVVRYVEFQIRTNCLSFTNQRILVVWFLLFICEYISEAVFNSAQMNKTGDLAQSNRKWYIIHLNIYIWPEWIGDWNVLENRTSSLLIDYTPTILTTDFAQGAKMLYFSTYLHRQIISTASTYIIKFTENPFHWRKKVKYYK